MASLTSTLERQADRLRGKRRDSPAERAQDLVANVPEAAEQAAEHAGERLAEEGRAAATRVESYLGESDDGIDYWGSHLAFAAGGFLVGLVLGWWLTRRRGRQVQPSEESGVAQAPATEVGGRPAGESPMTGAGR